MLLRITRVAIALPVAIAAFLYFMFAVGFASSGFTMQRCDEPVPIPRTAPLVCKQEQASPNSGIIRFLRAIDSDPRAGTASGRAILYLEAVDDRASIQ